MFTCSAAFYTVSTLLVYAGIWGLLTYMKEGGTDTAKLCPHDQTLFTVIDRLHVHGK